MKIKCRFAIIASLFIVNVSFVQWKDLAYIHSPCCGDHWACEILPWATRTPPDDRRPPDHRERGAPGGRRPCCWNTRTRSPWRILKISRVWLIVHRVLRNNKMSIDPRENILHLPQEKTFHPSGKFLISIIASVAPRSECDHLTKLSSENTLPPTRLLPTGSALSVRPKIGLGDITQDLSNAAPRSLLTARPMLKALTKVTARVGVMDYLWCNNHLSPPLDVTSLSQTW